MQCVVVRLQSSWHCSDHVEQVFIWIDELFLERSSRSHQAYSRQSVLVNLVHDSPPDVFYAIIMIVHKAEAWWPHLASALDAAGIKRSGFSLAGTITLCSSARHFTLRVLLSTHAVV